MYKTHISNIQYLMSTTLNPTSMIAKLFYNTNARRLIFVINPISLGNVPVNDVR